MFLLGESIDAMVLYIRALPGGGWVGMERVKKRRKEEPLSLVRQLVVEILCESFRKAVTWDRESAPPIKKKHAFPRTVVFTYGCGQKALLIFTFCMLDRHKCTDVICYHLIPLIICYAPYQNLMPSICP